MSNTFKIQTNDAKSIKTDTTSLITGNKSQNK
jgi:hypothetical protein